MEPDSSSVPFSAITLPDGVTIQEGSTFVAQSDIRARDEQRIVFKSGDIIKVTGIAYSYTQDKIILSIVGADTDVISLGDSNEGFMQLVLKGKLVKVHLK